MILALDGSLFDYLPPVAAPAVGFENRASFGGGVVLGGRTRIEDEKDDEERQNTHGKRLRWMDDDSITRFGGISSRERWRIAR